MKSAGYPKITFGIIVLNGEPFTAYNLRSLYPYAHEIILVEGASPKASSIATLDGHSIDATLEVLHSFKENEDPDDKLIIVTAEDEGHPNGFWPGEKDEQSRAYANRATGDYLWQVDIDEFYQPRDVEKILNILQSDPSVASISFKQITFWGGFDYFTDGWFLRGGEEVYHRLFKWGPGYSYAAHRPPTVWDSEGRDLRTLHWMNGKDTAKLGIFLYHYSLVFPKQVQEKCEYYRNQDWGHSLNACEWAENDYFNLKNPYRVHNVYTYPSWLMRFTGVHPPSIKKLIDDIDNGRIKINMRNNTDVEQIIDAFWYRMGIKILEIAGCAYYITANVVRYFRNLRRYPSKSI
jgi:hypothetical protein